MLLPTFLATIPDHRRPQGRLYGLEHLLLFSILAILSHATSYRKIQRFIDVRLPQLNAFCGVALEAGAGPHRDPLRPAEIGSGRRRGRLSGARGDTGRTVRWADRHRAGWQNLTRWF